MSEIISRLATDPWKQSGAARPENPSVAEWNGGNNPPYKDLKLTKGRLENQQTLESINAEWRAIEVLAMAHAERSLAQIQRCPAASMLALAQMEVAALERAAEIVRARIFRVQPQRSDLDGTA